MAKIKTMRRCPLFRILDYRDLAILAPLMNEEEFKEGAWLAEEGKPTSGLIVLKWGKVELQVKDMLGSMELGPLEFFGELSLIDGDQMRGVGALALTDVQILRLTNSHYLQLLNAHPQVAGKLAQGVLESLNQKMALTRKVLSELPLNEMSR